VVVGVLLNLRIRGVCVEGYIYLIGVLAGVMARIGFPEIAENLFDPSECR